MPTISKRVTMPIYEFRDPQSGDQWEERMSYDEMKQFVSDNPHLEQVYAMNIVGGHGDRTKSDGGFKEVMSRVADANPFSPLANDYGRKDSKTVKVRDAVQKVTKKVGGPMG